MATYNGWANYETWAVKLWMDNEEGSYRYWQQAARDAWAETDDKVPNQFMAHSENARAQLAAQLQAEHDWSGDFSPVRGVSGTVYADLLNAALGEVDWHEIADSLLSEMSDKVKV